MHPIKPKSETSPSYLILQKEPSSDVSFKYNKELSKYKDEKLVKFQQNPTKNWGPMSRHKRKFLFIYF